jgi:WD40 repeat protein
MRRVCLLPIVGLMLTAIGIAKPHPLARRSKEPRIRSLSAPGREVLSAHFSRSGRRIVVVSRRRAKGLEKQATQLAIWSLRGNRRLRKLGKGALDWRDGRFSANGKRIVAWTFGNRVYVFRVASGALEYELLRGPFKKNRGTYDRHIAWVYPSPDGRYWIVGNDGGFAEIYHQRSGKLHSWVAGETGSCCAGEDHAQPVLPVASSDGRLIVATTGPKRGFLGVWRAFGKKPPRAPVGKVRLDPDISSVTIVRRVGQRRLVLVGGWDHLLAEVWDAGRKKRTAQLEHSKSLVAARFLPDGSVVGIAANRRVGVYWNRSGRRLRITKPIAGEFNGMVRAARGGLVALLSKHEVVLWQPKRRRSRTLKMAVSAVEFDRLGRRLLLLDDKGSLKLLRLR